MPYVRADAEEPDGELIGRALPGGQRVEDRSPARAVAGSARYLEEGPQREGSPLVVAVPLDDRAEGAPLGLAAPALELEERPRAQLECLARARGEQQ